MNTFERAAPQQMKWLSSLPSQNFGRFFFTIQYPWWLGGLKIKHELRAIGQLCAGHEHSQNVCWQLYHDFPAHGRGLRYVSWRAVPDSPDPCKNRLGGIIENPRPFHGEKDSGDWQDYWTTRTASSDRPAT